MLDIVALTLPYAQYPFTRALEGIAAAGYRSIGIRTGLGEAHAGERIANDMTPEEAARVRRLCDDYGLAVSMLFGASVMKEDVESLSRHIDFARDVGADSVLWVGVWGYVRFPHEPLPQDQLQQLHVEFVDKMKRVAAHAEKKGVVITLKPHGGNTATGPILRNTLDEIGSPFVQASYDPGNVFYYEGIQPEPGIEAVRDVSYSFVMKDHDKEERRSKASIPGEGQIDFVGMLRTLRENGFKGPVVVEKVHGSPVDGEVTAEELDRRMARARANVIEILENAGYK